jgi:hypothetical protein
MDPLKNFRSSGHLDKFECENTAQHSDADAVKQLYSSLYGLYTEVLHDLTAVLKQSAAKAKTAKTTITVPPSLQEFREQRRWKRKPTDDADKRAKKPTTSTTGVNDSQLQSKPEVPTGN